VAESAALLADELKRNPPRKSKLDVTGKGLIEATKALAAVVPGALGIAEKIAKFVAGNGA
jgi:hypothetical protein